MLKAITNAVEVTVETSYQTSRSDGFSDEHVFAYRITITNLGDATVQLLRRHWHIVDSVVQKEVEGDGVVGQQPILEPGESHQYISGCHLQSDTGKMYGTYLFERVVDGHQFKVRIPEFQLIVPFKHN